MTDSDSRLVELEREIKACRRSAHRDRWIAGGLAALVMILMLGGADAPQITKFDTLWVKRLIIADSKGSVRMSMRVSDEDSTILSMADKEGTIRMTTALDAKGNPTIHMKDAKGSGGVLMSANMIGMLDGLGTVRMRMGLKGTGDLSMDMWDAKGNPRISMLVDDIVSGMNISDADGETLWSAP